MSYTINAVVRAFDLLFESLLRRDFSKSLRLHEKSEQELLPLVRTLLLGYFRESIVPEAKAKLPGSVSGNGRLDFQIENVAVELAVRRPNAAKSTLSATFNSSEVKKLMKHVGSHFLFYSIFPKHHTPARKSKLFASGLP
ncbi:MAG: hypothetical protein WBG50_26930 [Desulfomonilaceae bacterium]